MKRKSGTALMMFLLVIGAGSVLCGCPGILDPDAVPGDDRSDDAGSVPEAPGALTIGTDSSSVLLTWADCSNEAGYRIERSETADLSGYSEIGATDASVVTYQDELGAPGTTRYYRVRAFNDKGNSEYSNVVSVNFWLEVPFPETTEAVWTYTVDAERYSTTASHLVEQDVLLVRVTDTDPAQGAIRLEVWGRRGYLEGAFTVPAMVWLRLEPGGLEAAESAGGPWQTTYATGSETSWQGRFMLVPVITNPQTGATLDMIRTDPAGARSSYSNMSNPYATSRYNRSSAQRFSSDTGLTSSSFYSEYYNTSTYMQNSIDISISLRGYRVVLTDGNILSDGDWALPAYAPTNLAVFRLPENYLSVTWTDNSDHEDGFRLEWSQNGGDWVVKSTLDANSTSTLIAGTVGIAYSFRLMAYSATYGDSEYSNVVSITL